MASERLLWYVLGFSLLGLGVFALVSDLAGGPALLRVAAFATLVYISIRVSVRRVR